MIKNLVFKGGGVLGIAYAGVVDALEERKILAQIQRVAGTSAGAIIAAFISLRYTPDDMLKLVASTDFKSFQDPRNTSMQLSDRYGLYKGEAFLDWMKKCIAHKGLNENATFADFEKADMLDLRVFAADLNEHRLKEFSAAKTPNVIVAEAIRASIAIPLFFEAWTFSNHIPDNHVYVDGGTISTFPITAFDNADGTLNNETVGFYLNTVNGISQTSPLQNNELLQFANDFFETITNSQLIDFEKKPEEKNRVVIIDDFGISATNFGLTDTQKMRLYNSGKMATLAYLTNLSN